METIFTARRRPIIVAPLFLITSLIFALPTAAAPFDNGDFDGSDGWLGELIDIDDPSNDEVGIDPATFPQFALVGNGFARLSTDDTFDAVVLYQSFTLDASARTLSFDYGWTLTDGSATYPDFVQATLLTDDFMDSIDLFPGAVDTSAATGSGEANTDISVFVSNFAGRTVYLEFLVQDGDDDPGDVFQIGNIAISSVPNPSTLLLALPVLLLLRRRAGRPAPLKR
jgi:hypothetical protein